MISLPSLLVLIVAFLGSPSEAFVVRRGQSTVHHHPHHHHNRPSHHHRPSTQLSNNNNNANFVTEILDALDTMAGVSPFSEADLKTLPPEQLSETTQQRTSQAPPPDALAKPSVSIFFFLLGLFPCVVFVAAVQSGIKPFGL